MREKKFRAWDDKNNEWLYESNPELLTYYDFHIFGECTLICPPNVEDLQHIKISQYTGICDVDGNGIYENDILGFVDKVIWHRSITPLNYELKNEQNIQIVEIPKIYRESEYYINNYTKIIGNIHQNPELLENDND